MAHIRKIFMRRLKKTLSTATLGLFAFPFFSSTRPKHNSFCSLWASFTSDLNFLLLISPPVIKATCMISKDKNNSVWIMDSAPQKEPIKFLSHCSNWVLNSQDPMILHQVNASRTNLMLLGSAFWNSEILKLKNRKCASRHSSYCLFLAPKWLGGW